MSELEDVLYAQINDAEATIDDLSTQLEALEVQIKGEQLANAMLQAKIEAQREAMLKTADWIEELGFPVRAQALRLKAGGE